MAERGDDLNIPRTMDFTAAFIDQAKASSFAQRAAEQGYDVELEETRTVPTHPWDVVASREMTPTVDAVTRAETALSLLADEFGGIIDGWGCLAQN